MGDYTPKFEKIILRRNKMGEKRLKGKAIPKHETEADWLLSSYIPE
jgi:hypothetical protein